MTLLEAIPKLNELTTEELSLLSEQLQGYSQAKRNGFDASPEWIAELQRRASYPIGDSSRTMTFEEFEAGISEKYGSLSED